MHEDQSQEPLLPASVPVTMPELPLELIVNSAQQFKALGDPLRMRILRIVQHQPATAKQVAQALQVAPGTIGYHLQVLEEAGLVQVVARRVTHGIIARYYTRTARIFKFDFPKEVHGETSISLDIIQAAQQDFVETEAQEEGYDDLDGCRVALPRVRLSLERRGYYRQRLDDLVTEFLSEIPDPQGQVYDLLVAFFKAPPYMQHTYSEHVVADTDVKERAIDDVSGTDKDSPT
ncbi:MAG TPA: winged helix-turn-helix domain-containing protein [Dictyobacter sp.]|jgi:DNA-binding transcriptional ArsR family regulator|nr:winged helix-turn-helix domain-containing protein [Dictyobacter sp.]